MQMSECTSVLHSTYFSYLGWAL